MLATKFGFARTEQGLGLNSRPDNIRTVTDDSLRHLGVDQIDVVYQHRVDPDVPIFGARYSEDHAPVWI